MAGEMNVQAKLTEGVSFAVTTESGHQIILDGSSQAGGQNAGPSPMELLLTALAGCAGIGIIGILRKMRQQVSAYDIRVHATRVEQHPKIFEHITVEHILTGEQLSSSAVERAIALNEEYYCGVSAILGKSARITSTFQIIEDVTADSQA